MNIFTSTRLETRTKESNIDASYWCIKIRAYLNEILK